MENAVIDASSKQYKVNVGDELLLPRLEAKPKQKIVFDQVLLLFNDKKTKVGKPYIKGAKVEATVIEHLKGKKLRVATFKAKSRYRRVKGHRDHLTRVKIARIVSREK